jgi:hypothetical protein
MSACARKKSAAHFSHVDRPPFGVADVKRDLKKTEARSAHVTFSSQFFFTNARRQLHTSQSPRRCYGETKGTSSTRGYPHLPSLSPHTDGCYLSLNVIGFTACLPSCVGVANSSSRNGDIGLSVLDRSGFWTTTPTCIVH